jgi:hypothetical protein
MIATGDKENDIIAVPYIASRMTGVGGEGSGGGRRDVLSLSSYMEKLHGPANASQRRTSVPSSRQTPDGPTSRLQEGRHRDDQLSQIKLYLCSPTPRYTRCGRAYNLAPSQQELQLFIDVPKLRFFSAGDLQVSVDYLTPGFPKSVPSAYICRYQLKTTGSPRRSQHKSGRRI